MPIDINFTEHTNYLQMKVTGDNKNESMKSLEIAFEKCKNKNYKKLLLDFSDVDFKYVQDIDRYDFGNKIADFFPHPNFIKIAAITKKENYTGFANIIAYNKGANIKTFFKIKDAAKWLDE